MFRMGRWIEYQSNLSWRLDRLSLSSIGRELWTTSFKNMSLLNHKRWSKVPQLLVSWLRHGCVSGCSWVRIPVGAKTKGWSKTCLIISWHLLLGASIRSYLSNGMIVPSLTMIESPPLIFNELLCSISGHSIARDEHKLPNQGEMMQFQIA